MSVYQQFLNPTASRPEVTEAQAELMANEALMELGFIAQDVHVLNHAADLNEGLNGVTDTAAFAADKEGEADLHRSVNVMALQAIELAFAGQGVNAVEAVNVNMQSLGDAGAINMQSFKDIISSVWNAIKSTAIRLFERVRKFFKKHFGSVTRLRKRLQKLIDRTEKMAAYTTEETKIELKSEVRYLTVNEKILTNFSEVLKLIEDIKDVATYMYGEWPKKVKEFGETLEGKLSDFDTSADNAAGEANVINGEAAKVKFNHSKFSSVNDDGRAPEKVTRKKFDIFNNQSLFAADEFDVTGAGSASEKAKIYSKARVTMEPTKPKLKDFEDSKEISIWSVDNVRTLAQELITLLDVVSRYDDSKLAKELEKTLGKVTKAGDKLAAARLKEQEIKTDVNANAVALQNYVQAYANWSCSATASFAAQVTNSISALAGISSDMLGQYKK